MSFSPKFFWQFFSWNQSCQQLKSPKPQHFHEFSPKTIRQFFLGKQSWIFGQKMKISNSVSIYLFWLYTHKIISSFCSQFSGDWSVSSNYSYWRKRKTIHWLWSSYENQFANFQVLLRLFKDFLIFEIFWISILYFF